MKSTILLALLIVLLMVGIFALDLYLPFHAAWGISYVAVVLIGLRFPRREHALLIAALCSILVITSTCLRGVLWPATWDPMISITNGVLALAALWVAALCARSVDVEQIKRS